MAVRGMAVPAGASAALVAAVAADYRLQWTHDLWLAWKLGPILVGGRMRMNWDSYNIADMWKESVRKFAHETFTIFEHRRLSFQDCDNISNQMAHFLLQQGLCPGQVCALMMENKPEFVCWWLGMAKIGVKVAMLNYNLTGRGLAHCVSVAECCALIFDEGTEVNLHSMDSQIKETGLQLFCWGGKPHLNFSTTPTVVDYDLLLSFPYRGDFVELRKGINFTDVFGFIYTSGTTGLPKAAKVTHARMYGLGGVSRLLALQPGDVLYTCLPLYHTAGGALGAMSCFLSGATMALAKKFSAARFWREISEQRCTVFQYIGELGRYLVNYAREHPEVCHIRHRLRGAIGNGLRPEVWDEFQDKFNIPVVVEFYGATEGNGALVNVCRKSDRQLRGAVGRGGLGFDLVTGFKIVKFDVENECPIRDSKGHCIEAAPGEPGELLFPIKEDHPSKRFDGYTDPKATEKKALAFSQVCGLEHVGFQKVFFHQQKTQPIALHCLKLLKCRLILNAANALKPSMAALAFPKALVISSAPLIYLKLLRALYVHSYRRSPALAEALGNLLKFIGAGLFAAGHGLQCIHKGSAEYTDWGYILACTPCLNIAFGGALLGRPQPSALLASGLLLHVAYDPLLLRAWRAGTEKLLPAIGVSAAMLLTWLGTVATSLEHQLLTQSPLLPVPVSPSAGNSCVEHASQEVLF
ncbi:unnamed protein product [Durusdinium trenchii]|uniref:AMP-dependent synthetase/ligase domain-containing protein n=1 Tax=Durusdinium trenchii TaxID=1381693 RepID=A0ABP0LYQ8_9DINO